MEEQSIGSYKILRKIGAGGMAKVYLAVHEDVPNLRVILKILSDPRHGDRFRQEADKLALLDGNPNICRIKHFFKHGDDTVIAMEYVEGVTLEDKLAEKGRMAAAEAVPITCQVLDILQFAHEKGIFHRDIKPSNIMIDERGHVKIIDFGIAKGETDPDLTAVGSACGTPAYMAPEQFNPDVRTNYSLIDVYAVGTTLYKMLTGELPFPGDNPFAIRDNKLFAEPPSLREKNPEIKKDLERIVLKSLARDPQGRYQSAHEMQSALKAAAAGLDIGGPTEMVDKAATPPSTPVRPQPKGKSRLPLIVAGAAVVVIAALAYWLFTGPDETAEQAPATEGRAEDAGTEQVSPPGVVEISVTPSGDIYFDDSLVLVGTKGAIVEGAPGSHVVRIENARSEEKYYVDTIELVSGQTLPAVFTFTLPKATQPPTRPSQPPATPATGKIAVGSRPPNGVVYIDGEMQEQRTNYTFTVETGRHTIRVEKDVEGVLLSQDTTLTVERNQTHRVILDLRE